MVRCFVNRQQELAKALLIWREYDAPPAFAVAWVLLRARLAHAFGWQLEYIDGLAPATIAELLGYLGGM
ncbi:MAG: hypothetical protein MUE54_14010 [Anaerolineae bacterium]|nr:hypothetical protein [Anaerolineae bacterium]